MIRVLSQLNKRVVALTLTISLAVGVTSYAATALASQAGTEQREGLRIDQSGGPAREVSERMEILSFEPLGDQKRHVVLVGTDKSQLYLPLRLTAMVETHDFNYISESGLIVYDFAYVGGWGFGYEIIRGPIMIVQTYVRVSWVSYPEYNAFTAGEYVFKAVVCDEFYLSDCVEVPKITVTVEPIISPAELISFNTFSAISIPPHAIAILTMESGHFRAKWDLNIHGCAQSFHGFMSAAILSSMFRPNCLVP